MTDGYRLSIVVPCYNEEETLPHTIPAMLAFFRSLQINEKYGLSDFELLLIDDGSTDCTWRLIDELSRSGPVTSVKLSRNFGHQNAMLAGLSVAKGDAILTIDADLQDDISAVTRMLEAYERGADLALGVRKSRNRDTLFKRTSAQGYYKFLRLMGSRVVENHADFRLMSRRALDSLLAHEETNLFIRGIIPTLGYKTEIVLYDRQSREFGETKYTFRKMLSLALDGVTSFSAMPLRMVAVLGFVIFFISVAVAVWALVVRFFYGAAVPGWTSTLLPMLALGSLQIFSIGIVGEYIGKIYLEVKRRPRFIIETINVGSRAR